MDQSLTKPEVLQMIKSELDAREFYNAFNVTFIPYHTHNQVDSPGVTWSDLLGNYVRLVSFQNQLTAANFAVNHTIFVNDNLSGQYNVAAVSAVFGTASTSGTLQVEVCTSTTAMASGVNQLVSTISLGGSANTTVNGIVIKVPTIISAGARVNLIFAGTVTNLVNCAIAVILQKIK